MAGSIPPDHFHTFILTEPLVHGNQQLLAQVWVTWLQDLFRALGCDHVMVESDPGAPLELRVRLRVHHLPHYVERTQVIPLADAPYKVEIAAQIKTEVFDYPSKIAKEDGNGR